MKIEGRIWKNGPRRYLIIELPQLTIDSKLWSQIKQLSFVKKLITHATSKKDFRVEITVQKGVNFSITSRIKDV